MVPDIRIHLSLRDVPRDDWNACFTGELENYDYLLATEDADLDGFQWRYVAAYADGALVAAMPAFLTNYALDTTLEGTGKRITTSLKNHFPNALTLKLACLGSPVTEVGKVGFHASIADAEKAALLTAMLEHFETHVAEAGYRLLGIKDIPAPEQAMWQAPLAQHGYASVGALPIASLAISARSMDAYFATLSHATRKDMRRKLKARDGLRIEQRTDIADVLPQMLALYQATRARAEMQLEELNEAFFTGVLAIMKDHAFCTLYWHGDELLAFNLLLRNDATLLDKFFCMDARGREHNLYFVSWFTNVEYCIAHSLQTYQSGAAGYANKLRLGSQLTPTTMSFKHTNRFIQGALRLVAPFLAADTPNADKEAA